MSVMYIVLSISKGVAKNNSPYVRLQLKSESDELALTVWNFNKTLKVGDSVEVDHYDSKDGFNSTTAGYIKIYSTPKDSPLLKFIPKPPSREKWFELCDGISDLVEYPATWLSLSKNLYDIYSANVAAAHNHHTFKGGLAQHTFEMLQMAFALIENNAIPFKINKFVVFTALLFHDFGKIDEYNVDDLSYKPQMFLLGHPFISAASFDKIAEKSLNELPQNVVNGIKHCILAHHMFKEWGSPVVPCNQEAMMVACIDMLSGKGTQLANAKDMDSVDGTKVIHI